MSVAIEGVFLKFVGHECTCEGRQLDVNVLVRVFQGVSANSRHARWGLYGEGRQLGANLGTGVA